MKVPLDSTVAIRVLLIENSLSVVRLIRDYVGTSRRPTFLLETVSSLSVALPRLQSGGVDVVVVALGLPDAIGVTAVDRIFQVAPDLPIVTLAEGREHEDAVLRLHAQDYLDKTTMTAGAFLRSIRYAVERNRMERAMRAREGSFRAVVTNSVDGVVVTGLDGRILFVNPAAERLFGKNPATLVGESFGIPVMRGKTSHLELGGRRHVEMRAVDTMWDGGPAYTVLLRDVTEQVESRYSLEQVNRELQAANARLEQLAHVDPLTDLLNRRGFEQVLREEVERSHRNGSHIGAALVDCDDFKQINDGFGHDVGDAVLKEVARRLRLGLRPTDRVARVGGDEFLVLLPETRPSEAAHVAERLRSAIADVPVDVHGRQICVTSSLALVDVADNIESVRDILSQAHGALKRAKTNGKNLVTVGRRGGAAKTKEPQEAASSGDLMLLQDTDNLSVVFQPIHDLESQRVVGCELLTRGPKGALESPVDFFRLCFEARCVTSVDLSCLEACAIASLRLPTVGRFHVNLFPHTLVEVPTHGITSRLELGVELDRYCVEVSEQQFVGDLVRLKRQVEALRQSGIRIAIDDVGFGRSALETLVLLEPDVIKIDRRYVEGCSADAGRKRALSRVVHIANAFGAEVIAEGVVSRDDLSYLCDLGVKRGQGFYWGLPQRVDSAASEPSFLFRHASKSG